jgi:hypothetical protein
MPGKLLLHTQLPTNYGSIMQEIQSLTTPFWNTQGGLLPIDKQAPTVDCRTFRNKLEVQDVLPVKKDIKYHLPF